MQPTDFAQLIAAAVTIALIVVAGHRYGSEWMNQLKQLGDELLHRVPVYSAETIQRKEAEFIRDRLPKKFPLRLALLLLMVFGAVAWWLTS